MEEEKKQSKKKKSRAAKNRLLQAILLVLLFVLLVVYLIGVWFYRGHFLRGTQIDRVDASNLTPADLEQMVDEYALQITERKSDGTALQEYIWGNEISLGYSSEDAVRTILKEQNNWLWLFSGGGEHNTRNMLVYDTRKLQQKILNLSGFQEEFARMPEDAHISEYDPANGFTIVPEVQGNALDQKKAESVIENALKELETEVDLEAEDCYLKPELYADSPVLQQELESMQKCASVKITYVFGEHREELDGETVSTWLSMQDGQIQVDADAVEEYVASLRKKYDTIFRSRTFHTSYGKEITINGGDYGWWMNYKEEEKELTDMILAGESGERTPVYFQTAASYDMPDYGNTYVEINLTAQHLFLYVDGVNVLESDLVSGNPSRGNGTPAGVYSVTYKQRDATLVGENYSTPVKWWMPFNKNIGLHDASWRSEFGGNIYQTSGSHGCINLPPKVAEKIYSQISKGTAVICYELPGTGAIPIVQEAPEAPETAE